MKNTLVILFAFCCTVVMAHPKMQFDPEAFKQKFHEFLIEEASLTPEEQKVFFPLFDECKEKERALYGEQRKAAWHPRTDEDCIKAINAYDNIGLKLKKLQQTYHKKYLKVLPPQKVWKIIRAEDKFRQKMIKNMSKHRRR